MESLKYIETLDSFGEDTKLYVVVDHNDFGEIFITVKNKKTLSSMAEVVWMEFDRESAFELAQQILKNLVDYPNDQVARLNKGLDCACNHRKEVFGSEE